MVCHRSHRAHRMDADIRVFSPCYWFHHQLKSGCWLEKVVMTWLYHPCFENEQCFNKKKKGLCLVIHQNNISLENFPVSNESIKASENKKKNPQDPK